MKVRLVVYGSILVALVAVALVVRSQARWEMASTQAAKAATPRPYVPETPIVTGPDRRLTLAFDDVGRVLGADSGAGVELRESGGGWVLEHGGAAVDSVRAWASFEDLFAILVRRARVAAAGRRVVTDAGARVPADESASIRTALRADRDWASRGPRTSTLLAGTAALVDLATLVPDEVGLADRLLARALALTALSEAVAPGQAATEIALVAHVLGYRASACRRAEQLPAADPVRAFVTHDDAGLERLAVRKGASRRARQLHLVRLAEKRDAAGWEAWLERAFPGDRDWSLLATGMSLRRFETNARLGEALIAHLADELRLLDGHDAVGASTDLGTLAGVMDAFEARLGDMKDNADGTFLDREVLAAYYRDTWYSSLQLTGEHLRVSLGSIPAAQQFAEELGEGGAPYAAEFRACYRHLAALDTDGQDLGKLGADLRDARLFGGVMLIRPVLELLARSDPFDFARRMAVARLAKRLDQRPEYRLVVGWLLRGGVDPALSEDYLAQALDEAAPNDAGLHGWWAGFQGDADELRRWLDEPTLQPDDLKSLLEQYAAMEGVAPDSVDARWRDAATRHPADWSIAAGRAKRLAARGARMEALELVRDWRARNRPEGFDDIYSRTELARRLDAEGRTGAALEVVAPAAVSMQFGAMDQYSRLLEKLGRTREADSVALAALVRYPQTPQATVLALGRLWRRKAYQESAALLASMHTRIPKSVWSEGVWPEFHRAFGDDRRAASAALAAMHANEMQWWVPATVLGHDGAMEGDPWIAQTLAAGMKARGQDDLARLLVVHDAMRRTSGPAAADRWLKVQMLAKTPGERGVAYMMAYETGRTAAMWLLAPEGTGRAELEFNWLMRACAVLEHEGPGAHREAVDAWFASTGSTRYQVFGRYLLGSASEEEVLEHATERRARCEAYYYVGLRAELEGRYRDAASWYARSLETRDRLSGEYRWSALKLAKWGAENLSLAALARRDARRERSAAPPSVPRPAGGGSTPTVG